MSAKVKQVEPVGLKEIAARLNYPPQSVKQWHSMRHVMPEPGPGKVSGAPWWDWAVIEAWAKETGRWREAAPVTPEG